MTQRIGQNREKIISIIFMGGFIFGLIFLRLFYITRTTGPFIYADEFGYWSHAAHMAGQTWAGVMNGVSWYSFGYSFWLALSFLFSDRMIVMYRIAIILNVMMCLGILFFGLCCHQKAGEGADSSYMWFYCFCGDLFSDVYLLLLYDDVRDCAGASGMAFVFMSWFLWKKIRSGGRECCWG